MRTYKIKKVNEINYERNEPKDVSFFIIRFKDLFLWETIGEVTFYSGRWTPFKFKTLNDAKKYLNQIKIIETKLRENE